MEFHRDSFTGTPRCGKRREKPGCGVKHRPRRWDETVTCCVPLDGPRYWGGSLDVLIVSLIAQLCRLPICLTKSADDDGVTASHDSESAGQVVVAARSTSRSCSPRRSSS